MKILIATVSYYWFLTQTQTHFIAVLLHLLLTAPVNKRNEDFIIEIGPLDREWVNAIVDGDMNNIHRILMSIMTVMSTRTS